MIYAAGTNRAGATNRLPGYSKFARGRFVIKVASKYVDLVDDARSSWQSINQPSMSGRTERGLTSFQLAQQQSARPIRHCLVVASSVCGGGVS